MSLDIRPLAPADAPDWRRLWAAYLAFYEAERPDEVFETTFRRFLDPAEPMRAWLALKDGASVGLAHVIRHRHGWSVADVAYLQDLYVDAPARGGGVGRALIEAVYAWADSEGLAQVYWVTQTHNAAARRLYDRIGVATPFMKYNRR